MSHHHHHEEHHHKKDNHHDKQTHHHKEGHSQKDGDHQSKHNISSHPYTFFSQRNQKWDKETIGHTNSTIGDYGCFLSCLGMMVGKTPSAVNDILTKANAYKGDLIDEGAAARALGLSFSGRSTNVNSEPNWSPTIQEVDYSSKPGIQRHFVLRIVENGRASIIDPLDLSPRAKSVNHYHFLSYRLFKKV
jgi:hypothetical protein